VTAGTLRRPAALLLVALCTVALAGCANTVQVRPIPHNILEGLLLAPYPVYWVGGSFHALMITEAAKDPGGAYRVQYGNCSEAGQSACITALRVVTSPDNSFIPGAATGALHTRLRGIPAIVGQSGQTIELPTGDVVVSIHAQSPRLAASAAQMILPINIPAVPLAALPGALPPTAFADTPLPDQLPSQLQPLPGPQLLR
jgi:hypothetical protein